MKLKKINVGKNYTETTRANGEIGSSFSYPQGESASLDLSQYALKTEVKFTQGDGFNSVIEKDHFLQANNDDETAVGKYNQSVADETLFTVGNGTDENDRKNAFAVTTSGDASVANNLSVENEITANSVSATTTTTTTLSATTLSATTANVSKITSDSISNSGIIESNGFKGNEAVINDMSVKNLKVTGSAHFFELIIDKVKSAGGSMLITPADGFDADIVQDSTNEVKLLWQCQDANGNQRDNMWKVNDQALCMSFNQAKVGTSHNVANKYYWALVTSVNKTNEPTVIDGVKYNYITLSKITVDGTLNPEVGDTIVMCGYRGTDDKDRQSAIYISAYTSLDNGLKAPLFAQYQGINDFNLQSHRKSYFDAVSAKFIGDFEVESGQSLLELIDNKIKESEASIKLDTKNIVLSVSEKTRERRNLLKGTTFHRQLDNFSISDNARIEMNSGYNGTNCIKVIDDTDGISHYVGVYWDGSQGGRSIRIEKGKKYTISCYYKTNDTNANFSLEAIYTDKETNAKRLGRPKFLSPNNFTPKYNEWQLCTTVIDTTDAESDYIAFNFWEYCNKENGRINAYICRPMVEEGDTYYGWTVSDEDNDYIGANLIDNSRTFEVGGNTLEAKGTKTLKGDTYELTYEGSDEYNTFYRIDATNFKLDTDYTLSFEARGDAKYIGVHAYYPITKTPYTLLNEAIDNLMYEQDGDGTSEAYTTLLTNSDIEREKKLWVHFKFKERLPQQIYFQFPKNQEESGVTSWNVAITKPKIEEGANVTQWTEKKTDIDNTITTINSNVATLTQKADSIESKVSSNTTNINTITGQLSSQSSSISKLEQKANSIESKVSSNTTTINNINGQVTANKTDIANLTIKADGIESTVSSMKDEIIGENCMLGLNGQGWSNNTVYNDAGNSFHCESTDWFQSHPIEDFNGDYTFSFNLWSAGSGNLQIKILEFTQTYHDDGIYNKYVDFGLYTPCKILTTSSNVSNATLTNYATSGTSSTWTYTNTETITLAVGDNVAVRVTNSTNNRYNSIYGTVSAINTSSKSVTVKAIALLDQPNAICTLSCPMDKKDGTDINYLHYDEKLGRYWIRSKESRGAAKTFVILFRNLDTSSIGYISRLMLEEGVEYPHKYNSTGQASQSMIKQTANEIMMSVNNTYVKIGDGNITLNGDTKINGSLTLHDEDTGFVLQGTSGTTEIKPKSIGTYEDFKNTTSIVINTDYSRNVNGGYKGNDANGNMRYDYQYEETHDWGNRKKYDYISLDGFSFMMRFTNNRGETFATTNNQYTLNYEILENGTVKKQGTLKEVKSLTYTVTADSQVTFKVKYHFTDSSTAYNPSIHHAYQLPLTLLSFKWNTTYPSGGIHTVIGQDGWTSNFGNNTTVYCGKDGFIANYGDTLFKITTDGIVERRNGASIETISGSTSSTLPYEYKLKDGIDTILCKQGNTIVILPSKPYQGQRFKIYDKSLDGETWINFQGYMVRANKTYNDRTREMSFQCDGQYVRIYTFIGDTWYEEFVG